MNQLDGDNHQNFIILKITSLNSFTGKDII